MRRSAEGMPRNRAIAVLATMSIAACSTTAPLPGPISSFVGSPAASPISTRGPSRQLRSTTVHPGDYPRLTVECRTDPPAPAGECEGWAVTVLDEFQTLVPRTVQLVLSGKLGPGLQDETCTAEFVDAFHRVASEAIRCWVPTGG